MEGILKNIFQIRSKLGLSQEYVANQLQMKQSGYAMIENGQRELKFSTLSRIAIVFNMDVIDVIKFPERFINENSKKS
ncbi:MAG: helix-turn-helix transcriptional regulator [Bacteroidales bacterium]|nr:helix-turn-helix transcriptional regulator [Bacteroidales bacterium]